MSSLMFNNSSILFPSNAAREELRQYAAYVNRNIFVIQILICIFGLLGNLLAIIVINQKSLRNTSSAVFITYMACFDSSVLVLHAMNLAKLPRNLFLLCSLTFLTDFSIFCANWVLVIITLERCVAVYFPFLAKRFCTVHSARCSVYILLTIAILFLSVTSPFIYQIKGIPKTDKCRINPKVAKLLRFYQAISFIIIPDILLLSNLFTVYALCRRGQRLAAAQLNNGEKLQMRITDIHSNRKQRQLTVMLITVSLSFYLFTTPAMIFFITELQPASGKTTDEKKRMFLLSQISVVFSELNNATNFIFYCFTGERFRHTTKQVLLSSSRRFKIFYHRYILGDKQYHLASVYQYRLGSTGNTTMTMRGSMSLNYQRRQSTP